MSIITCFAWACTISSKLDEPTTCSNMASILHECNTVNRAPVPIQRPLEYVLHSSLSIDASYHKGITNTYKHCSYGDDHYNSKVLTIDCQSIAFLLWWRPLGRYLHSNTYINHSENVFDNVENLYTPSNQEPRDSQLSIKVQHLTASRNLSRLL